MTTPFIPFVQRGWDWHHPVNRVGHPRNETRQTPSPGWQPGGPPGWPTPSETCTGVPLAPKAAAAAPAAAAGGGAAGRSAVAAAAAGH